MPGVLTTWSTPSFPSIKSVTVRITSGYWFVPIKTSLNPGDCGRPRREWTLGFLRSASMSKIRFPSCANVIARLTTVVVFPSSAAALTKEIALSPCDPPANCRLVRSDRYPSAAWDLRSNRERR